MSYPFAEHPKGTRHRLRSVSCSKAIRVTTGARSLVCLRLFSQAPEYGKALHSHTQGLTLKGLSDNHDFCLSAADQACC